MRISFFGSRGIPACYSGFETAVEQLSVRLAHRGHEVLVYNRIPFNRYAGNEFKGVRIVRLPTIRTKATDTIVHTALSVVHSLGNPCDIAYFCGVGNSLLSFVPKCRGARAVLNVDGADFARAKWTGFGRWWLQKSERWATSLADVIIADNGTIQKRYKEVFGVTPEMIPYGANVVTEDPGQEALAPFDLQPNGYLLYVSRLVPENAADLMIEAYLASGVDLPLLIVGDAPYQEEFIGRIKRMASGNPRIRFTGFLFGEAYRQLSFHARAFVLPTAIDATRPVLLDQMAFGNCIIVRDTPGNLEVTGDAAITFSHENPVVSLAEQLQKVSKDPALAEQYGKKAILRVQEHFDWEVITTRYEKLFEQLMESKRSS